MTAHSLVEVKKNKLVRLKDLFYLFIIIILFNRESCANSVLMWLKVGLSVEIEQIGDFFTQTKQTTPIRLHHCLDWYQLLLINFDL